jgi:hypothetical protein
MRRIITALAALALAGAGVLAAVPAASAQPCTAGTKCVNQSVSATLTIQAEETLTISAPSLSLGTYTVGGASTLLSTANNAEVATVTNGDAAGYTLTLFATQTNGTFPDGYWQGVTPANQIKDANSLTVERTATTAQWIPWSNNATAMATLAGPGALNCGATPGCTESGGSDVYAFGLQQNVSGAAPDSYTQPFVVSLLGG